MTLIEIIKKLSNLEDELTIYAVRPWRENSEALAADEQAEGAEVEILEKGFDYFIEVFIAKEFISDWEQSLKCQPTIEERVLRLIQYAENDA